MIKGFIALFLFASVTQTAFSADYPKEWWKKIPESQRKSWEILPQDAKHGEVILSKRTELGIFSNFGNAEMKFEGHTYQSLEGLWQMMKYPDPLLKKDPRKKFKYPYTRAEVRALHGHDAKDAGKAAGKINKPNKFNWVSYKGKMFHYKDMDVGSRYHYKIMYAATMAKVMQNPDVKKLLLKTKGLKLRPDHNQGKNLPPSYKYYDILMKIRDSIK